VNPSTNESDIILKAITREKASYAHLAAAARNCQNPQGRRLYNQLALDELKHLLALVSLLDGLADDCLERLDLTFPAGQQQSAAVAQPDDSILRTALAVEQRKTDQFKDLVAGVSQEELLTLLTTLYSEEEDHLARLKSLQYGLEADRPVVAKWLRSIRRLVPPPYLH
jgi:rubrerythrin